MNPPGRPKGEYRSAPREGIPMTSITSPDAGALRCVLDVRASLGECPVWSIAEQVLYWVDINAPSLNRFDPATGINRVMPMPASIGCFALRKARRIRRRAARRHLARRADGALEQRIADAPYDPAHHRFNDGRCDRQGRFFAGTMNERRDAPSAALYRLDPDFRLTRCCGGHDDFSNGLAFSPDGRTMYHADTPTRTIRAFDFDTGDGHAVPAARVRATFDGETDRPDGERGRQRRLLLDRVLPRRQGRAALAARASCSPNIPLPRDVSDDVRVRRRRSADALRDERAPAARRGRARAPAAIGRHLRDAASTSRGCPSPRSPADPRHACFDPSAFLRLDAPQSLGASASGASFATSTGDILEVSCYGPGVFRVRVGPNTRPDYGLVVGRTQACNVAQTATGAGRSSRATPSLEIAGAPLRFRLRATRQAGARVDHRRALPRLDAAADVRPRARRAANGSRRSRWLPANRSTVSARNSARSTSAASSSTRRSTTRSASTPALAYKNVPFAWSPGTGSGAWGIFVNTPGTVTHGVGHPDWSHRSYAVRRRRRSARSLPVCARDAPAGILDATRSSPAARRRCRCGASACGSRAPTTRPPRKRSTVAAKLRERKIPCDVLTLDGRAAWDVETRFDFEWDAQRFPDPSRRSPRSRRTTCASACGNTRTCRSTRRSSRSSRRAGYLLTTADGGPYVFGWDTSPATSPFGDVLTPLPESGLVDFTQSRRVRLVARRARAAVRRTAST